MAFGKSVIVLFIGHLLLHTSCMVKDKPYQLPPLDTSLYHSEVFLGNDYERQLYFNLEDNQVVHTSLYNEWDIALESSEGGFHIFMNGGNDVQMYKYGQYGFANVTSLNAAVTWGFDDPALRPENTYVGDWRQAALSGKPYLYLVKLSEDSIMKIIFTSVSTTAYEIQYGPLQSNISKTLIIPKSKEHGLVYFTFKDGGKAVQPDAATNNYDLIFTRYKHIYYELDNFPYLVNGTLLNYEGVSATIDSVKSYNSITKEDIPRYNFSFNRNTIGFDWKIYDFNTQQYKVRPNYTYIIKRATGEVWKLKFISFYDKNGMKGYPSFEYKQLK